MIPFFLIILTFKDNDKFRLDKKYDSFSSEKKFIRRVKVSRSSIFGCTCPLLITTFVQKNCAL